MKIMKKIKDGLTIRYVVARDLETICDIENDSYEFPWTKGEFALSRVDRKQVFMVAESDNKVVGYMIYKLLMHSIKILNITVVSGLRKHGIGEAMVDRLKNKMRTGNRSSIMADVRDSNLPAHLFFKAIGFRATKVFKDKYENVDDDCYRFIFTDS